MLFCLPREILLHKTTEISSKQNSDNNINKTSYPLGEGSKQKAERVFWLLVSGNPPYLPSSLIQLLFLELAPV